MTGAYRVARAAPDGYQFAIGNAGTHAVNQKLYKNRATTRRLTSRRSR